MNDCRRLTFIAYATSLVGAGAITLLIAWMPLGEGISVGVAMFIAAPSILLVFCLFGAAVYAGGRAIWDSRELPAWADRAVLVTSMVGLVGSGYVAGRLLLRL